LFGGGFNVGINVNANKIIYNDILAQVVDLLTTFKTNNKETIFNSILKVIEQFGLSDSTKNTYEDYKCSSSDGLGKHNKEAYLKLREYYNQLEIQSYEKNIIFYTLVCYSFSNQIRFNSKNKFNMPYGKRDFNKNLRVNLDKFLDRLHSISVNFVNKNFEEVSVSKLNDNDFVYADPPYLITCASYNEQDGWNEDKEKALLNLLDKLNSNGIKFALSNVLESKGNSNYILKEWSKKYIVHYLNSNYSNANYHKKDKSKDSTIEVLITNY
jgi:DNA adenine methylase Dam